MVKKTRRQEAIYARQSVDKKDSVSIETQIDECKRHCNSASPRIYQDKGYSGKNTQRPDVQRLIKDIEAGLIEKVVVYKLDRISRNITDFYKLYEVMQSHDCQFVSHSEAFDTTSSMGRAMMGILAVFAQMERENIVMRVKDNYDYRLKSGTWATGKAPYGFKNGKNDQGQKTLIPIPEEIEVVKWMYETYAMSTSISLGKIQSMLIARGHVPHQSDKGFSRTTILHILSNPIYTSANKLIFQFFQSKLVGFVNDESEWDGSRACAIVGLDGRSLNTPDLSNVSVYLTNVKGIVSPKTWLAVQARLSQNKQLASDNSPLNALQELSGLLKCADCGSAIKMQARPTLTCTGRGQRKICSNSFAGLKLSTVQNAVAAEIQAYLNGIVQTQAQYESKRKAQLEEIAELEKRLERMLEIAETSDSLGEVMKKRLDALVVEINTKKVNLSMYDAEDTLAMRLGNYEKRQRAIVPQAPYYDYRSMSTEQRQTVLRALVKRIFLHTDGTVSIEWRN